MLPNMFLHMAVRLLCGDNYLTACADRFLVGLKKGMTSGLSRGVWAAAGQEPGREPGGEIAWDILEKVLLMLPELHSRATCWITGRNSHTLRALRLPRTPFPGHILDARSQL